jgi:hypothetical protein
MVKAAFNKKNTLSTSKLDLSLRRKLVKWYVAYMVQKLWHFEKYTKDIFKVFKYGARQKREKIM